MLKVSVIIPVYNTEKFLERCLDSVCKQTLSDIEIICINDCSTDNSLALLQEYAERDKRIKLIDFKENKGAAAARNSGIDAAAGEYIGFVDSDDYIDLDFYEKLYEKAIESGADIAKSNLEFINWNKLSAATYYNLAQVRENKINFNHIPTAIFRNELLNNNKIRYPEDLRCAEDSVFEALVSTACNKIEVVEDVTYHYVYRDDSLNHLEFITLEKLKDVEKSLLRVFKILEKALDKETYFNIVELRYKYLSRFCNNKKMSDEAKKYLPTAERNVLFSIKNRDEFFKRKFEQRVKKAWKVKYKEVHPEKFKEISKLDQEINKSKLDIKIKEFNQIAVTSVKRRPRFIISLTSYPERVNDDIQYCLFSLLQQTLKPDEIILWLGKEQFPQKEKDIPVEVLKFQENGLTIKFTKDIKSYKKLIPALQEYEDDVIITADDDIFYSKLWFEKLYNAYLEDNQNILCHRAHKIKFTFANQFALYNEWTKCIKESSVSFLNFCTTGGGVLFPPKSLYKDVLNEELFMKLAPRADDIWFWTMAVLNKRKIRVIKEPLNTIVPVNYQREHGLNSGATLYSTNIVQNDVQLKNIAEYYPKLFNILAEENHG